MERLIAELASSWGVQTTYRDSTGRPRESPRDAVLEVVGALTADTSVGPWPGGGTGGFRAARDEEWIRRALEFRRARLSERLVTPVVVAWDGLVRLGVPRGARAVVKLDDGREAPLETRGQRLPFGYHHLRLEVENRVEDATVISAPRRCWDGSADSPGWGVFAPTYALRSDRDWGAGDLAELDTLLGTVADAGGGAVSTLPVLAAYLDAPFEPAPYSPVSRLFWNEFYLAVDRLPEWNGCASARAIWESREVQDKVARWRDQPLVDYAGLMALKRRIVGELCAHFFREGGGCRREGLEEFVRERPDALVYAEFRARVEARGSDWRSWPWAERSGADIVPAVEGLSDSGRYHLYAQWQMEDQLGCLSGSARLGGQGARHERTAGLFLDVPVGVHPGGFDVWRQRDMFVEGVSIGAPPDSFFRHGQCWDSPPLHPEGMLVDGLSHWRKVLAHHMRLAPRLRIDHMMSLHRLFWIPEKREPSEGVYVDYPADELYAVLCLESHKHQTMVTGEDLGTVPGGVRPRMRRHGVTGTWVLQGAVKTRAEKVLKDIPGRAVATLGTHDMFPLAGFLRGDDIRVRLRTGQIDDREAQRALSARHRLVTRLSDLLVGRDRAQGTAAMLMGALSYLGASEASFVLVDLVDLLHQREPHNVPGIDYEGADWRRKVQGDAADIERAVCEAGRLFSGRSQPPSDAVSCS